MNVARVKRGVVMALLGASTWCTHSTAYAEVPDAPATSAPSRASTPPRARPESYGAMLLKMMLGVMVITLLAYVVIRYGLKRFIPGSPQHGAMEVLLRQPIEPKRSLLLVRVASRHLLLASHETGVALLTELSPEDVQEMMGRPLKKEEISKAFSIELDDPTSPEV